MRSRRNASSGHSRFIPRSAFGLWRGTARWRTGKRSSLDETSALFCSVRYSRRPTVTFRTALPVSPKTICLMRRLRRGRRFEYASCMSRSHDERNFQSFTLSQQFLYTVFRKFW